MAYYKGQYFKTFYRVVVASFPTRSKICSQVLIYQTFIYDIISMLGTNIQRRLRDRNLRMDKGKVETGVRSRALKVRVKYRALKIII